MKRIIIFSFFALLISPSFGQNTKNVSDFTGLSVSGNLIVKIVPTTGNTKVEYTIIKGDEEDFVIKVEDKSLKLKVNNMFGRSKTKVEATVYYNKLNSISASAGSNLSNETPLITEYLSLSASSGSNARLAVNSNSTNISASSGTSVSLSGKAGSGSMSASSGASVNAKELVFSELSVSSSSGASISTHVTESMTASASSGGSVSYKGDPKNITKNKSSSGGSVSKM
jgi:hypothetical protein